MLFYPYIIDLLSEHANHSGVTSTSASSMEAIEEDCDDKMAVRCLHSLYVIFMPSSHTNVQK